MLPPYHMRLLLLLALTFSTVASAQVLPGSAGSHPDYGSGLEAYEQALSYAVPFAQEMLAEVGTFGPFGLAVTDETLIPVQVWQDEYGPETAAVTAQVLRQFAEEGVHLEGQPAMTLRAAAVVADILTQVPGRAGRTDAIAVMLESERREPVAYILPYVRDEAGEIEYLEPLWRPQPSLIFVGSGGK